MHLMPHRGVIKRKAAQHCQNMSKILLSDLSKYTFPKEAIEQLATSVILTSHVVIVPVGNRNYTISYQMSHFNDDATTILFFHGARFNFKTWFEIKTMHFFSILGYNTFVINLPVFGEILHAAMSQPAEFMKNLIRALKLKSCFIVSPSYSGIFSIPLLQQYPECIEGFIAIAPTATDSIEQEDYEKIRVPILIIRGEHDNDVGITAIMNLKKIPTSCVAIMPNVGHACYLDDPDIFHTILYNFLRAVLASNVKVNVSFQNYII